MQIVRDSLASFTEISTQDCYDIIISFPSCVTVLDGGFIAVGCLSCLLTALGSSSWFKFVSDSRRGHFDWSQVLATILLIPS